MTCTRRRLSYWTTCDCPDCHRDRLRAHKAHHAGSRTRVPNETAWEVLAAKIDAGWTARALGSATGLDPENSTTRSLYFSRHIAAYRKGRRVHLGPGVAAIIMTMGQPTRGQVGAGPSRRRLRALATIGHGLESIATETGIKFSTLAAIRSDNSVRCGAVAANTIADTYDRIHMTIGDDTQAQRIAREKGWRAPMFYDDIDQTSKATGRDKWDESLVDHAVIDIVWAGGKKPRKLTSAECAELVRRCDDRGISGTQIEALYGIRPERYRHKGAA